MVPNFSDRFPDFSSVLKFPPLQVFQLKLEHPDITISEFYGGKSISAIFLEQPSQHLITKSPLLCSIFTVSG